MASPILRMVSQRRAFSIATRVRTLARSFGPRPFERYHPTTVKAQKADWGRQGRRLGDAAMFYFPFMVFVVSWPLLGEAVLDGHVK